MHLQPLTNVLTSFARASVDESGNIGSGRFESRYSSLQMLKSGVETTLSIPIYRTNRYHALDEPPTLIDEWKY
jgi:hypothetical protein